MVRNHFVQPVTSDRVFLQGLFLNFVPASSVTNSLCSRNCTVSSYLLSSSSQYSLWCPRYRFPAVLQKVGGPTVIAYPLNSDLSHRLCREVLACSVVATRRLASTSLSLCFCRNFVPLAPQREQQKISFLSPFTITKIDLFFDVYIGHVRRDCTRRRGCGGL